MLNPNIEEIEVEILQGDVPNGVGYYIYKVSGQPLSSQEILDTISDVLLQQYGDTFRGFRRESDA